MIEIPSYKEFKNKDINEAKKDLSKFADKIAKMTDRNDHGKARLLMAELTEDKKLIEVVKATNIISDYSGSNPISSFTNELYKNINYLGRKKYGTEDWDKYIYSNT